MTVSIITAAAAVNTHPLDLWSHCSFASFRRHSVVVVVLAQSGHRRGGGGKMLIHTSMVRAACQGGASLSYTNENAQMNE